MSQLLREVEGDVIDDQPSGEFTVELKVKVPQKVSVNVEEDTNPGAPRPQLLTED